MRGLDRSLRHDPRDTITCSAQGNTRTFLFLVCSVQVAEALTLLDCALLDDSLVDYGACAAARQLVHPPSAAGLLDALAAARAVGSAAWAATCARCDGGLAASDACSMDCTSPTPTDYMISIGTRTGFKRTALLASCFQQTDHSAFEI